MYYGNEAGTTLAISILEVELSITLRQDCSRNFHQVGDPQQNAGPVVKPSSPPHYQPM